MKAPEETVPLARNGRRLVVAALVLGAVATAIMVLTDRKGIVVVATVAATFFVLGLILWWFGTDASHGWDDLGRSLVLSAVLAVVGGAIQHELDEDGNRRALQLSLSEAKNLTGVDLAERDLRDFRIPETNLHSADLHGAHLEGADMFNSDFTEANLRGAHLQGADLRRADLSRADLSDADLRDADLTLASLKGTNLGGANLSGARLTSAVLSFACLAPGGSGDPSPTNLTDADLTGADLRDAVLTKANLSGAKLETDLRPARLLRVGLKDAVLDRRTVVPGDFDMELALRGSPPRFIPNARPPKRVPPPRPTRPLHAVQVTEVSDGDTLRLEGTDSRAREVFRVLGRARLAGIDAPSPKRDDDIGARATENLSKLEGTYVRAELASDEPDPFGRRIVRIWLDDGTLLNEQLVAKGFAKRIPEPPAGRFDARLEAAETRAKQRGLGVWERCD